MSHLRNILLNLKFFHLNLTNMFEPILRIRLSRKGGDIYRQTEKINTSFTRDIRHVNLVNFFFFLVTFDSRNGFDTAKTVRFSSRDHDEHRIPGSD